MDKLKVIINILFLFVFMVNAQKEDFQLISEEEYKILNDFFDCQEKKSRTKVYHRAYFDKGWGDYFVKENLNRMKSRVGIPTIITDEDLDKLLTREVCSKVSNKIAISQPLKFRSKFLCRNVKLVKKYDSENKDVLRISEPIIVGDLAIFRTISYDEAPIYVLKKNHNNWKIIYTFYDWLILE